MCPIFLPRAITVLLAVHDLAFLRYPQTCVWSNRLIQKYLLPGAIRRSDIIAPVSDYIAREMEHAYPGLLPGEKMRPVYDGGPGWHLPPGYAEGNRRDFLLFVGNLEPRKNLVRVIEALELLRRNHGMTIPLHLVGPAGWKNRSLHATIEASIIRKDIIVRGYLSEEELKREVPCLQSADIPLIV